MFSSSDLVISFRDTIKQASFQMIYVFSKDKYGVNFLHIQKSIF